MKVVSKSNTPKPIASPRRRREPRIRAIMAAAEKVFLEKGFEAGSLDDVAKHANASKATIYAHFGNKVGLFRSIITEKISAVAAPLQHDAADHVPAREVLRLVGTAFLTTLLSPVAIKFYRLMVSQGGQFPELAQTWFASGPKVAIGSLAVFLKERTASGELEVDDPEQAAEFFLMSLRGVLHLRSATQLSKPPYTKDIAKKTAAAADMFIRAYGVPQIDNRR